MVTTTSTTTSMIKETLVSTGVVQKISIRPRTLVITAQRMKPLTRMWMFMSSTPLTNMFVPATELQIGTAGPKFIGYVGSAKTNENLISGARNGIASYDLLEYGETISTTGGGTAVVVADETIYDIVAQTHKRILYVVNTKGTLSGTITSSISGLTADIIAQSVSTSVKTNSLGSLYGSIIIPADTFAGGLHGILITDSQDGNLKTSESYAVSSYETDGNVDTFVKTQVFETVDFITNTSENVITKYIDPPAVPPPPAPEPSKPVWAIDMSWSPPPEPATVPPVPETVPPTVSPPPPAQQVPPPPPNQPAAPAPAPVPDPCANPDKFYLDTYPDIAASSFATHPYDHWVGTGQFEGRKSCWPKVTPPPPPPPPPPAPPPQICTPGTLQTYTGGAMNLGWTLGTQTCSADGMSWVITIPSARRTGGGE